MPKLEKKKSSFQKNFFKMRKKNFSEFEKVFLKWDFFFFVFLSLENRSEKKIEYMIEKSVFVFVNLGMHSGVDPNLSPYLGSSRMTICIGRYVSE